jgi:hypothetical protein
MGLYKILEEAGLGVPLGVAVAVYGLFAFLDRRTSTQAKKALSAWLQAPPTFATGQVADFVLEAFDRVFTRPLLGWRAMARSVVWTLFVCGIVLWELMPEQFLYDYGMWLIKIGPQVIANLISDYLSLFVVRGWLNIARTRPLLALVGATVVGAVIIFIANNIIHVLLTFVLIMSAMEIGPAQAIMSAIEGVMEYWTRHLGMFGWRLEVATWLAAMAIHLWLLLFAIGLVLIRAMWWLLWLSGKSQWFWKRGKERPFNAIGWVVAPVVFAIGVALHYLY